MNQKLIHGWTEEFNARKGGIKKMRKRKIKKTGNSYYVKLEQTDMKDMDLEVGDYVIIEREAKKKIQSTDSVLGKHKGCGKNTGEYTYPCGTYIGDNGYDYTVLCKNCSSNLNQEGSNGNTGGEE